MLNGFSDKSEYTLHGNDMKNISNDKEIPALAGITIWKLY
jgi:hypothetical protein